MTEKEFIETARGFGYSEKEIEEFIKLCKSIDINYQDLAIEKHHKLP